MNHLIRHCVTPNTEENMYTRPCNNQQECGVFATASAILLDSSDSVIG